MTDRKKEIEELGFSTLDSETIAVGLYVDEDHKENSVAIPLERKDTSTNLWESISIADDIKHTVGFLTWESETESAQALLLGVKSQNINPAAVLDQYSNEEIDIINDKNVLSIKLIVDDGSFTDSLTSDEKENVNLSSASSTASEPVGQCVGDSLGLLGISDGIVTCAGCIIPGNGLGPGDVLECFYCAAQGLTDICVVGYCQRKNGGSLGDKFCDVAEAIEVTPLYLLPGSPNNEYLNLQAAAASYGCSSDVDEANDCLSPVIP